MSRVWLGSMMLAVSLVSPLALAHVKHEGVWPTTEKSVTLKLDHVPRAEAVRKLAQEAGWSLVIHAPPGDPVDVSVKDQPANKVLDVLLDDRAYVAKRDGALISIDLDTGADAASGAPTPAVAPVPPVPPVPPLPPVAAMSDAETPPAEAGAARPERKRPENPGKDQTITGDNLRIAKGQVVHNVVLIGGNADVWGTVTGNVSVTGGNLRIHDSGWVLGDATVIGGNLVIDDDGDVDGNAKVMGGSLHRSDKCHIGGNVIQGDDDDEADAPDAANVSPLHPVKLKGVVGHIGGALTHSAMLFVFGAVLLALAAKRMETLRVEAAARPMRSFAVGVVGAMAGAVLFVAFCITVIGIPVAVVGLLLGVFGAYAGVCAVLTVVGEGLLRHKTTNPYVHLGLGCALFMVISAIPFVGSFVTAGVSFLGIGVLVATRAAGLVREKNGKVPSSAPYRTAPSSYT